MLGLNSPRKGKKKSTKSPKLDHLWKVVEILELLPLLLRKHQMIDTIILSLNAVAIPSFFIPGIHFFQLAALSVVREVRFFRTSVSDLRSFRIIRNFESSSLKTYLRIFINSQPPNEISELTSPLFLVIRLLVSRLADQDGVAIQTVTALVLQLIHACHESYQSALNVANSFVQSFLANCSTKSDFRPLLENFIDDLITCFNQPHWPSATLLLNLFCQAMTSVLISRVPSQEKLRSLRFVHALRCMS